MLPISGYQGEEFSTFPSASSPLVECNEDQTNAIVSFLMTIITEKDKVLPVTSLNTGLPLCLGILMFLYFFWTLLHRKCGSQVGHGPFQSYSSQFACASCFILEWLISICSQSHHRLHLCIFCVQITPVQPSPLPAKAFPLVFVLQQKWVSCTCVSEVRAAVHGIFFWDTWLRVLRPNWCTGNNHVKETRTLKPRQ